MSGINLHKTLTAAEVDIDGALLNASNSSAPITCSGMNQATFIFNHTDNATGGGGFACNWYFEISIDGGTTWSRLQTESISSGVSTLSNYSYTKTLTATAVFTIDIPLNYSHIRIKALTGVSAAAGDKMSVTCRLGAI